MVRIDLRELMLSEMQTQGAEMSDGSWVTLLFVFCELRRVLIVLSVE
jgi:hypothetical protein